MKKYKVCCRGKVDWETLPLSDTASAVRHLTTRGKNRFFLNLVLDALQLDTHEGAIDMPNFKRAFTSAAVKKIFEAVRFVWPDGEDLKRVLRQEAAQTSGLYIGHYGLELVRRGVTRHSLYADRILLVDPLLHPNSTRDEFNPILNPAMHRTSTLKWISLWLSLEPWIEEGIVGFVRAPGDFYPDLALKSFEMTRTRFARHPELLKLYDEQAQAEKLLPHFASFKEQILLTTPDSIIRSKVCEREPASTDAQVEAVIAAVHRQREAHPNFLGPERPNESYHEMLQLSTGTNYEQAKLIALHSSSYVMTDLRVRLREIEVDRSDSGVDSEAWSPFSKAFQGLSFNFLDAVPLDAALAIRREGRLESMRHFLRKVWNATAKTSPFDDAHIPALAAELDEKIREAAVEWKKIDRELVSRIGMQGVPGLMAAGPLIASGYAAFVGAAAVLAGESTSLSVDDSARSIGWSTQRVSSSICRRGGTVRAIRRSTNLVDRFVRFTRGDRLVGPLRRHRRPHSASCGREGESRRSPRCCRRRPLD
jgi:hypothetical protein